MINDIEQFKKEWNDGVPVQAMADKRGIGRSTVSSYAQKLGLDPRQKPLTPEERIEAEEYIAEHGTMAAVKKYGFSYSTAARFAKEREIRASKRDTSELLMDGVIRVLKQVPSGFNPPKRGMGW